MAKSILINLNRCVGCWSCSMACKVAYDLEYDEFKQFVRTIGGGQTDEPGGEWPNLYMKWMPIYTDNCSSCSGEDSTRNQPYCVFNCPTYALSYGDLDDASSPISQCLDDLLNKGYNIYQLSAWERTSKRVHYAEKGI